MCARANQMSAGAYLRKRREAARLDLRQAAATMAALPFAIRRATPEEVRRLMARLDDAEEGREPFDRRRAEVVRSVFAFDVDVYERLLAGEPVQVCRICACSWQDACVSRGLFGELRPCSWAEPDLCSACLPAALAEAELRPAPGTPIMPGVAA